MKLVAVIAMYLIVGTFTAISVAGCHSSEDASAAAAVAKEDPAAERKRIEADTSMPPMAKQAALQAIERREHEKKK